DDGALRAWDRETLAPRRGKPALPHGLRDLTRPFATDASGNVATAEEDGTIRVTGWKPLARGARDVDVDALALHPDGRLLVLAGDTLEIWKAGRRVGRATLAIPGPWSVSGRPMIAISADGQTAVTGGASDFLVVWDLARVAPRGVLYMSEGHPLGVFSL